MGGAPANHVSELVQKGARLHQAGRAREAAAIYRQVLDIDPNHADANHLLGVVLYQLGNHAQAVESISRAIAMAPARPAYYGNLGTALQELGRLDDAVASYHKALAIKPDFSEAHSNLGNVLKKMGQLEEAVASYHRGLAINPEDAQAHYNLGNALKEMGRPEEALASYRKALAINPDFADAHSNLGNTLTGLGRWEEALASHRKTLALKPEDAQAHNNLGAVLQKMGRLEEAVTSYRKALAINPDHAAAHNNLGSVLTDLGRLEEAVNSYRKALASDPDCATAHMHLARIRKHSEYDNDIKAMEEKYANPDTSGEQRMYLAFGLGKAFEDLRKYDRAFDFFLEGNAIKRRAQSSAIEEHEANFDRLKEVFDSSLFEKFQGAGCTDDSPIFIVGMPRSGSTLVEQILASHPQVHGAGEIGTLGDVASERLTGHTAAALAEGIQRCDIVDFERMGTEYVAAIRKHAEKVKFVTNKMLVNFQLIGLIKCMLPNAKIIHCRRNPIDNCLSIFKCFFVTNNIAYSNDLNDLGRYFNGYRDLMKHWRSVLPGFVYDIQYEEMVADQAAQTRRLLEHCGLEWDDACLEFFKTDRPVATASAEQVRRPIYQDSVGSWKRYENQAAPLLEILGA